MPRKTPRSAKSKKTPRSAKSKRTTPRRRTATARTRAAKATPKGSPVLGTLGMVTLHVTDLQRSIAFYRDQLELPAGEVTDTPEMGWAEFDLGAVKLGLHADKGRLEEGARAPGGTTGFYFVVPSVDDSVAKLRGRGVKIAHEPADLPYGREATILDPDDNLIAVLQAPSR